MILMRLHTRQTSYTLALMMGDRRNAGFLNAAWGLPQIHEFLDISVGRFCADCIVLSGIWRAYAHTRSYTIVSPARWLGSW